MADDQGRVTAPTDDRVVEMYRLYIDYVRHENDLLHQRVTWFTTMQAALILVACYLMQRYFDSVWIAAKAAAAFDPKQQGLLLQLTLFWSFTCGLGVLSAWTARTSITAALEAQDCLCDRWAARFLTVSERIGLPPLMGGGSPRARSNGGSFAKNLPTVLGVCWLAFLVLGLGFVGTKLSFF